MDDIVSGARTKEDAYQLYKESKDLLRQGGFNLRKFVINSCQLQKKIDDSETKVNGNSPSTKMDETYTKSTLGATQKMCPREHKVLGVWVLTNLSLKLPR